MENQKKELQLGNVQETLFIPLYARSVESLKKSPIFYDSKSLEIIAKVPYNFEKFQKKKTLFTNVYRTYLFDLWVKEFIQKYPEATVVELGCGLNSRYERLDNGKIHWVDLDLPDVMEIRKNFFQENERRKMINGSIIEEGWIFYVKERFPSPYFLISEAVLVYIEKEDVKTYFKNVNRYFANTQSCIAFDSGSNSLIQYQHTHDILKNMNAKLKWALNDHKEIEEWAPNLELKETRRLLELPYYLKKRLSLIHRIFYPIYNRTFLRWALDYRLNLFCIK